MNSPGNVVLRRFSLADGPLKGACLVISASVSNAIIGQQTAGLPTNLRMLATDPHAFVSLTVLFFSVNMSGIELF